jgi:hypothetical protein
MVAVGLLLCAAPLVGTGSTATYAGETLACGGPIVRAESAAASAPSDPVSQGLARQCERQDRRQLALAGIAVLLGLVAGPVAMQSRPREREVTKVDALVG